MTSLLAIRRPLVTFVAAASFLAACGSGDVPDSLGLTDAVTESISSDAVSLDTVGLETTTTIGATGTVVSTSTEAPTLTTVASTISTVVPASTTIVSTVAPSTTVAPTTTAPSTTTAAPTTTTTAAPSVPTCTASRYEIETPAGWAVDNCERFTSGVFPAPGAPIEFRPEIEVSFTTAETFADAVSRINNTSTVLSTTSTTIDGLPAERMVIVDNAWFVEGETVIVAVDAGDGVLIASAAEVIDIQGPLQGGDIGSHHVYSVSIFDAMLSTIDIIESP